jgi:hypothetical protein
VGLLSKPVRPIDAVAVAAERGDRYAVVRLPKLMMTSEDVADQLNEAWTVHGYRLHSAFEEGGAGVLIFEAENNAKQLG